MKQLLVILIAAATVGCAGPAGYGLGATAESYRICGRAPETPGCENGFTTPEYESDDHYAARMQLIGDFIRAHPRQPRPIMPFEQRPGAIFILDH